MRFSTARSLVLATLLPTLVLFALVSGCAKQSEGERCGDSLGAGASDDCGDNLTCKYIGPGKGDNRCCYSDGHITDSRCEMSTSSSSGGAGSGGASAGSNAGGSVATAGSGGATAGGGGSSAGGGEPAAAGAEEN